MLQEILTPGETSTLLYVIYSQFTNNCIARLLLRTFEFVFGYAIEIIIKCFLIFISDNATCTSPDWHRNIA